MRRIYQPLGIMLRPVNLATVRKIDRRTIRLPDIDPTIAQANAIGAVSLTAALKSAGFSIGVLVFFIVMIVGWPQLAMLQRGALESACGADRPQVLWDFGSVSVQVATCSRSHSFTRTHLRS